MTHPYYDIVNYEKDDLEEWYDIPNFNGLYRFSSTYKVLSLYNGKGYIKSYRLSNNGYPVVQLSKDGKKKILSIHWLSAFFFVPNPNNYKEINHKNGIKTDFTKENLEWCSRSYNVKHAYDTGLKSIKGESNGRSKLTDEKVIEIFRSVDNMREVAEKYNISICTVSDIKTGKVWNHITNIDNKRKPHLKESEIIEIYNSPLRNCKLAKLYNVSDNAISDIKRLKKHSELIKRTIAV